MKTNKTPADVPLNAEASFVPTHGGVYHVAESGNVTVLEGGPAAVETPALNAEQPESAA